MPDPTDRSVPAEPHPHVARTPLGKIEFAVRGSGMPVLVLHGSPGGLDQGELMARFLPPDRVMAILVSRPGYLGTPLGARPGIDREADLLAALLDELRVARAGVLAWSGGGPSGYRLAARHPERVGAMVCIAAVSKRLVVPDNDLASTVLFNTWPGERLMALLAARQPRRLVSSVLDNEGSLTAEQRDRRTEEILADPVKRRFVLALTATVSQRGRRRPGWRNDRARFAAIHDLGLASVTAPVLLVHGDVDTDVTPDHSIDADRALPNSEVLSLPAGTHLAFFTHPEAKQAQARALDHLLSST